MKRPMSQTIRTRFAPSPTGFLHIGGARTALFNYYFSKKMGGEFLLRIEDTDKARSTDEAVQAIINGLDWLGIPHDGQIVYQSQNAALHVQVANDLLAAGKAYKCYATPEELELYREKAHEAGHAFRSPYRDDQTNLDRPFTVRFKVPEGQTHITDHVQSAITWENSAFDDMVLLRADGSPTYMLAVVVDDHNMGITHVIRGDDHLINAGRQAQIYAAMEWDIPEWAHVPLIYGPDGKKLSKRHGALAIEAYRDMGYLPSGLRNYLVKLGWAHGDTELFFKDEEISEVFTLGGINSAPARLDFDKMDFINGQHIDKADEQQLLVSAKSFLCEINNGPLSDMQINRVLKAMKTLKDRSKTLKDIAKQAEYLLMHRPLSLDGKALKPLRKDGAIALVQALTLSLKSLEECEWTAEGIQQLLEYFVSENDIGFGKVGQPTRAALTAGTPSPDLSQVISFLGKSETLGRLSDVIAANNQTV